MGRLFNIGVGAVFGLSAYTVAFLTNHNVYNPLILIASGVEYMLLTFLTTLARATLPSVAANHRRRQPPAGKRRPPALVQ